MMNKAANFRWVGIDTPGDITEPTAEFAVWFAHQRHSMSIEISDFLSALVLLSERELCKRWVNPQACVSLCGARIFPRHLGMLSCKKHVVGSFQGCFT
jgi:hypothetical protein